MDALEMLNKGIDELNALLDGCDMMQKEIDEGLNEIGKILDELA